MKPLVLSKRLQAVADMVSSGSRVCDVGCDHGFVSVYLVEQGVSPRVLAMDVRRGPLSAAARHVEEHGLVSRIETRISNGLHNYKIGEAETLICAGMGGKLMMRILSEERDKADSFREMILQPQSDVEAFRRFLYRRGYSIAEENMIEEDGKFYPVMRAVREAIPPAMPDTLALRYGPLLLKNKSQALLKFLRREERIYGEILENLRLRGLADKKRQERFAEVEGLLLACRSAIAIAASGEGQTD
ncbi:MAG: class I SAM-dependent methyltransferase [Clostridiales bacterium]|nr:class I SAM-dependent methyltransferase [Clostridiales bacterium]